MNSLKQVIINAVIKVSADPLYAHREYASPDDARGDFIKALIAELFPECPDCVLPSAAQASEVSDGGGPVAKPAKEPKKRAPKKETVVEAEPKAEVAAGAELGKEPKKRAPKKEAAAGAEPGKEKKKPGPKPKAKPEGPVNLEKLNPTQTKKLKSIADELKGEVDKKAFHEYLNSLPKEEYDAKTFDDHARTFLAPPAPVAEEPVLTKCAKVEWQGAVYLVDPETQKIYAPRGSINEHVGHVGMLEFAGLEIPTE